MENHPMNRRQFLSSGAAGTALAAGMGQNSPNAGSLTLAGSIDLRYRQVHLDFHTSEEISGVGAAFDPDEFASTLVQAHVNSVTCFGRCHHGWIYHRTRQFPERRHPHLTCNLLEEQIEACHKRNIRVPIYVTVQWDYYTTQNNPDWLQYTPDGRWNGTPPYEAGFYTRLCMNSPYVDFLKSYLADLFEAVPVDGLFLDIVHPQDCSCRHCLRDMETRRIDASQSRARQDFGMEVYRNFVSDCTTFVRSLSRECSIFYNSGHVGPWLRPSAQAYTHLELESLPSAQWGYMHFPLTVRYARNLHMDVMGMTGKFHTSWGDFHSFKNPAALQFECFQMLAHNAKCSVGDQLPPNGRIDPHTYALIGSVYAEVEQKEPWCTGAKAVTDIGVISPEEFLAYGSANRTPPAATGAVRILQEGRHQFEMLDTAADFSPYGVLLLPDNIPVSEPLGRKLQRYLDGGGSILASYESGLSPDKRDFMLDSWGVQKAGEGPLDAAGRPVHGRHFDRHDYLQYLIPSGLLSAGLPETEHAMYMRGLDIHVRQGAEVLGYNTLSYFDRTWEHFCSHRQTPSSGNTGLPAVVQNGRVIYMSHPVFTQYDLCAPLWYKKLVLNALQLLLPDPLVQTDAPSTVVATLNNQAAYNRWVVHLLHYIPERRGKSFDTIEDVIPIQDVHLSVRAPESVHRVLLAPQETVLPFVRAGNRIEFTVQEVRGHQMVVLEFS